MGIPDGYWHLWKRFQCEEAEIKVDLDQAEADQNKDEIIRLQEKLLTNYHAWIDQLMIWEGVRDTRNLIYLKFKEALENGTEPPNTKTWGPDDHNY
jgi:hypothetical protein